MYATHACLCRGKQYISAASHLFSTENFPALMKSDSNTMNSNVLLQWCHSFHSLSIITNASAVYILP